MKTVLIKLALCVLIYALVTLPVIPAIASDVSDADFYGIVQTTNNDTAETGVVTTITGMNFTALMAAGFVNSSANNCAIQSSTGTDIPFMPGYGTNPTIMYNGSVAADSITNSFFYTKGVTGGKIVWIPGSTGGTIPDGMTEPAASFNMTIEGYLNTAQTNSVIFNHSNIPAGGVDSATVGSGEVMLSTGLIDRFYYDGWTDVGGGAIAVDSITDKRYEYSANYSATDTRCYADLGVGTISDTAWSMNFTLENNDKTIGTPAFSFGIFSAAANFNGYAGDALGWRMYAAPATTIVIFRHDGGVVAYSGGITITDNVTYYGTIRRNTAILATLNIYSDAGRTTEIAGSPVTLAIPATVTGLRYIQGTNDNTGAAPNTNITGWLDDVFLNTTQAKVTGIAAGETTIVSSLSGGVLTNTVGASTATNTFAGAIANSAATWLFAPDIIMPYVESIEYWQGGAKVDLFGWEYTAVFTGDTTGNVLTPSFPGAGNDPDISSNLVSFQPITEPIAPAFAVGVGPDFWDTSNVTSGNFTTGNVTLDFPLKDLIEDVAAAGGVPYQIPSTFISSFCVVALSLLTSFFLKRYSAQSLFIKSVVNTTAYGVLIALQIYDWWMLIFFFIFEQAIWFGAQHRRE